MPYPPRPLPAFPGTAQSKTQPRRRFIRQVGNCRSCHGLSDRQESSSGRQSGDRPKSRRRSGRWRDWWETAGASKHRVSPIDPLDHQCPGQSGDSRKRDYALLAMHMPAGLHVRQILLSKL